jgi:hypothetical protein
MIDLDVSEIVKKYHPEMSDIERLTIVKEAIDFISENFNKFMCKIISSKLSENQLHVTMCIYLSFFSSAVSSIIINGTNVKEHRLSLMDDHIKSLKECIEESFKNDM